MVNIDDIKQRRLERTYSDYNSDSIQDQLMEITRTPSLSQPKSTTGFMIKGKDNNKKKTKHDKKKKKKKKKKGVFSKISNMFPAKR